MKAKTKTCHWVELCLDPIDFPDHESVIELMRRLPVLGLLDSIELGIGPHGGGRLSFIVQGARGKFREKLGEMVGEAAILSCTARPA